MYDKINKVLKKINDNFGGGKIILDEEYFSEFKDYVRVVYNTEEYLKKGQISNSLLGDLPLILPKSNDLIYELIDSNCDLEKYTFTELLEIGVIVECDI